MEVHETSCYHRSLEAFQSWRLIWRRRRRGDSHRCTFDLAILDRWTPYRHIYYLPCNLREIKDAFKATLAFCCRKIYAKTFNCWYYPKIIITEETIPFSSENTHFTEIFAFVNLKYICPLNRYVYDICTDLKIINTINYKFLVT